MRQFVIAVRSAQRAMYAPLHPANGGIAARSIDRQSSAICEHSIAVAEQMLSNAFVCARKVIHVREPQELAQIQTDFVTRQAQVLELGQKMMHRAQEVAKATEEGTAESRRRSEAA